MFFCVQKEKKKSRRVSEEKEACVCILLSSVDAQCMSASVTA